MTLLAATVTRAKYHFAAVRDELAFAIGNLPARFSSVQLSPNIPFGKEPGQSLDVYALPELHDRPIVVFWYGGDGPTAAKKNIDLSVPRSPNAASSRSTGLSQVLPRPCSFLHSSTTAPGRWCGRASTPTSGAATDREWS